MVRGAFLAERATVSVRHVLCLLLAGLAWTVGEGAACLPEGNRLTHAKQNIAMQGVSLPFGIYKMEWPSGMVSAHVLKILAEDVMHFSVHMPQGGVTSPAGLMALVGCQDPTLLGQTWCGDPEVPSKFHASLELWPTSIQSALQDIEAHMLDVMPEMVGPMGYVGQEFMSLKKNRIEMAYNESGISLDWYRSYDATWSSTYAMDAFFQNHEEVDPAILQNCTDTICQNNGFMRSYLDVTSDTGGVQTNADGDLTCRCDDSGKWWLAPACRSNPSTCIPMVTGGNGWGFDQFMQKAASFNMPLALATLVEYEASQLDAYSKDFLQYGWEPDTTFIKLSPVSIVFPQHKPEDWARNDKRTEAVRLDLGKWVHKDLKASAEALYTLVKELRLTTSMMNEMLMDVMTENPSFTDQGAEAAVCKWLTANREVWRPWIPDRTQCAQGFGIQDMAGNFVDAIDVAVSCTVCPPGRKSVAITSQSGKRSFRCQLCEVGTYSSYTATNCTECEPGRFASATGSSLCTEVAIGSYTNESASSQAKPCPVGTFSATTGAKECTPCALGTFTAESGSVLCARAEKGHFNGELGMSEQKPCPMGTFSKQEGQSQCQNCTAGQFSDVVMSTACMRCPVGTFAAQEGHTECTACPWRGTSTLGLGAAQISECICLGATYMPPGYISCQPCPPGLSCSDGQRKIQEGFWGVDYDNIFACHGDRRRCIGGEAGQVCAANRIGIACAECLPDTYPADDGTCATCKTHDGWAFIITSIFLVVLLVLVYWVMDRVNHYSQAHTTLCCALGMSMMITMSQQLGILASLDFPWQEPLASFLRLVKVTTFLSEPLQLGCLVKGGPLGRLVLKVSFWVCALAVVCVSHAVNCQVFRNGQYKQNWASLVSAIGVLCMVFYMSAIMVVLGPVQCRPNPNGLWTSLAYPSVVCWQGGEHSWMVVIAAIGMTFPIAFLTKCAMVVRYIPRAVANGDQSKLLREYAFLFFRYRPEVYWYSLVHFARSLCFTFIPMLGNIGVQLVAMQVLVISLFAATVHYKPWRVWEANVLDLWCLFVLTLIIFSCALFVPREDAEDLSRIIGVLVIFGLTTIFPLVFIYALGKGLRNSVKKPIGYFVCHHKAGSGCRARLLKIFLSEHQSVRSKSVFIDSDDLKDMDTLFDTIRFSTEVVVVLCTQDLLLRPWCIGELVSARQAEVPIVKVAFPDFEEPNQRFFKMFKKAVPDIMCLTSRGIADGMIFDLLKAFPSFRTILVPDISCQETVMALTEEICSISRNKLNGIGSATTCRSFEGKAPESPTCALLVDHTNPEAVATAFVICKMVTPLLWHRQGCRQDLVPFVLQSDEKLPQTTKVVILVCTQGALGQSSVLRMLSDAVELDTAYIIVLADDKFTFPTNSFIQENLGVASLVTEQPQTLLQLVFEMFSSIAVAFQPTHFSASQEVLNSKANDITDRLMLLIEIEDLPESPRRYSRKSLVSSSSSQAELAARDNFLPASFLDELARTPTSRSKASNDDGNPLSDVPSGNEIMSQGTKDNVSSMGGDSQSLAGPMSQRTTMACELPRFSHTPSSSYCLGADPVVPGTSSVNSLLLASSSVEGQISSPRTLSGAASEAALVALMQERARQVKPQPQGYQSPQGFRSKDSLPSIDAASVSLSQISPGSAIESL